MRDSLQPKGELVPRLIDVLQQIQTRTVAFIGVLDREETALKTLCLADLAETNLTKQGLLEEIRTLDQQRIALVERLADGWSVPAGTLGLLDIAKRATGDKASDLNQLHDRLIRTIAAARDRNCYLASLVGRSIEFFRESIRFCRQSSEQAVLYSSAGRLRSTDADVGLIERRE